MISIISYLDRHAGAMITILLVLLVVENIIRIVISKSHTDKKRKTSSGDIQFLKEMWDITQDVFVLVYRKTGKVIFVSDNCSRVLGIPRQSVETDVRSLFDGVSDVDRRHLQEALEQWEKRDVFSREMVYTNPETMQQNWCKLELACGEDGRYLLCRLRNIEQEKQDRDHLLAQIAQVQAEDQSKTIFLSKMSHEIRTPMNGILGIMALARESADAGNMAEVGDYLSQAENLSQFLLSIINDILDMTRIESGKLELEKASFDILGVAEKIRAMFETNVQDKGIKFQMEVVDFTKRYVIGDELRITQVITNFLSNSSKFTPKGGTISVTFRQMDIRDNKMSFMMRVKDTGKGMSKEFLHRIFKPFEQEDSGIARQFGGSGLGMSIADNLVKQMNGQLLVDSVEGEGSEFTVFLELPLAQEQEIAAPTHQEVHEVSMGGRQLLMAEDNEINAMVATKLLSKLGLKIEVAQNGQKAVDAFASHEPGYYDAILMDLHMPVMDGWEATKVIRDMDRTDAGKIPIFALSADAFVEDKRHSIEIGMNGHINKPIDYKELQDALKASWQ